MVDWITPEYFARVLDALKHDHAAVCVDIDTAPYTRDDDERKRRIAEAIARGERVIYSVIWHWDAGDQMAVGEAPVKELRVTEDQALELLDLGAAWQGPKEHRPQRRKS